MRLGIPLRPPIIVLPDPEPPPPPQVVAVEEIVDGESVSAFSLRGLFWRGITYLLITLGIQLIASLMPPVVEVVYSTTLYRFVIKFLSTFNKFFPFSVGEIFYIGLAIWFVLWTLWYVRRAFRRETYFFYVIKLLFLHMLWTLSALSLFFIFMWGLNYQRQPIGLTMGLHSDWERRPPRSDELQSVGARIVNGINRNYTAAREGQDWAGPSRLPLTRQKLFQEIENTYQRSAFLAEASQGGLGPPKPLKLSRVFSVLGINGFYIPFTGEPTFNEENPSCDLPFVIAHVKAHQRGYAREDEANFVAYLICTNSADPYIRYSGYLHGLKVLDALEKAGIGRYRDQIGPGPSADLESSLQFWFTTKSPLLSTLTKRANSAYLRANRVRHGVMNYDEDIPLIVGYYIKNPVAQQ